MGLSTKQVSGDHQGFDRPSKTTLQSGAPELPKPPSSVRRQQQSEPLKCPRCSSTNTKFCYYNNYNKSQPRHFCKSCKRHWTKGGTLRNVPIGGGRKNKRPKISNAATTTAAQDCPKFPLSANTGNQKSISNILYQTLIGSPLLHEKSDNYGNISNGAINTINSTGLNVSAPHEEDPDTEFQFSSLSTFDMNTSLNLISYNESLNAFDRYAGNLDSVEESTFTTANNIPSSSSETWPGPNTDSSLELPNYWNWNEIDVLTSWNDDDDGAEIKP